MCATMNWVSCSGMSTGVAAMKMPDKPPIVNIDTKPMAFSIGTWKRRLPRHIVPSQLNTLIAEGTAMSSVETMNVDTRVGFMTLMNMWWTHTIQPRNAIPMRANTLATCATLDLRTP